VGAVHRIEDCIVHDLINQRIACAIPC
jgi:hypothetical protein